MRGRPASSRDRDPGRTRPSRGDAAGPGGDGLRLVRATRDQLRVAWSAAAAPVCWQVVCWDSRDTAVARLKLGGTHRRATFAGLACLRQPFTIAVSGLGRVGSVLWQAGLADLYLRVDRPAGRAWRLGLCLEARTGLETWRFDWRNGVDSLYVQSHGKNPQVVGDGEEDLTVHTPKTAKIF
jgi:hypothetical protein